MVILTLGGIVTGSLGRVLTARRGQGLAWLGAGFVAAVGYLDTVFRMGELSRGTLLVRDMFSDFFVFVMLAAGAFSLFSAVREAGGQEPESVRRPSLLLFALVGPLLVVSTANLVVVLVGIQLAWLGAWSLLRLERIPEPGRYLQRAAFVSLILLAGVALLGVSGLPLGLRALNQRLALGGVGVVGHLGVALVVASLAAQLAVVPFHGWTTDLWAAAPASSRIVMTAGSLAAVAPMGRLLANAGWGDAFCWFVGGLTLMAGALLVANERSPARLVGRLATANSGYILLGLLGGHGKTLGAALFYVLVHLLIVSGCAAGLASIAGAESGRRTAPESWAGLGHSRPRTAALLTFLLLAAGGVPLTAGFVAIVDVYLACIRFGYVGAAVVAGVSTLAVLLCVARAVCEMYGSEPSGAAAEGTGKDDPSLALVVCCIGVLALGLFPRSVVMLAEAAGQVLR